MKGRPDHLEDLSDVHGSEWPGRQEMRLGSQSIPILQKLIHRDSIPDQELGTFKTLSELSENRQCLPYLRCRQRSALFQAMRPIRLVLERDRTVQ